MYKLNTEFEFDSAHKLNDYNGKCANLHGHRWLVELEITGNKLNELGILWDFTNGKEIANYFDHKYLNDLMDVNPTAENISKLILELLKTKNPELNFKVRLYESPKSSCTVEG